MGGDQVKGSRHAKNSEWQEFGHGEDVTDLRACPHATIIHCCEQTDEQAEDHKSGDRLSGMRIEFVQVVNEQVGARCGSGEAGEPQHPTHLNAHEAAERHTSIQVRSAGLGELRRDFRETGHDDTDRRSGQQHRNRTCSSYQASDRRGQPENSAADNGVHDQRGQAPAPNCSHQAGLWWRRHKARLYHIFA